MQLDIYMRLKISQSEYCNINKSFHYIRQDPFFLQKFSVSDKLVCICI